MTMETQFERAEAALSHCEQCSVRNRAICNLLSSEEMRELAAITRHATFEPGQVILAEADSREIVGTVTAGVVKLTKALPDGRQQIVGLLFPSDFMGRLRAGESRVHAEAITRVEVCLFNAPRFRELTERYPVLKNGIYERALNDIDAAREWMVLLGRKTAEEKLATFLVMLAERAVIATCRRDATGAFMDEDGPVLLKLPMSRADMADHIGLTIETVSRQITRFKGNGLISVIGGRDLQIPDLGRLRAIAEG